MAHLGNQVKETAFAPNTSFRDEDLRYPRILTTFLQCIRRKRQTTEIMALVRARVQAEVQAQ